MAEKWIDSDDLLAEHLKDAQFRAEWERTALARAVALAVVRYRAEHGLSLRQLAKQLDMPHRQLARLESGDHNPTVEMLQRLAKGTGRRFIVAIAPPDQRGDVPLPDGAEVLTDLTLSDGTRLLAAAG